MKALKYLFVAMLPLGFVACNSEKEEEEIDLTTIHTQLQKDAQEYFQGNWVAEPIRVKYVTDDGIILYTQAIYADTISFGQAYTEPKVVNRNDFLKGEIYHFTAYGECVYKHKSKGEAIEYYYSISPEADEFILYDKETEKIYQSYQLSFESQTQFVLQNDIYPYVFNKEQ